MQLGSLLLTLAVMAPGAQPTQSPDEARLSHCLVSMIDDVKVASEYAGVLVSVDVREGTQVEAGTLLAKLNDSQAQSQKLVAEAERQVSQEKAENDVNVRYARAAQKVAQSEYELNKAANEKHTGTIPKVQMQKLALTVEQATLQIEQSQHEQQIARYETAGHAAKVAMADDEIHRRQIRSPISGEVVEVQFRPGEWVEPGDGVFRVVRLDRLRVEGFLNVSDFKPSDVSKRPVRVNVTLAHGRTESFTGEIVFVNPLVQAGGEFLVRAEVDNRMGANKQWVLRPGMLADMTIELGKLASLPPQSR
jgi:multidrug efflux pump subunit AcrA (membrane-fusion protein)